MDRQPLLEDAFPALEHTKFHAYHSRSFFDPEDPETESAHLHGYNEIYVNVSGHVSFLVNDRIYPIESGDAVISRPGDVHYCIFHAPEVSEYYCIFFQDSESSYITGLLREKQLHGQIRPRQERREAFFSALERLTSESPRRSELERLISFLTILEILGDGSRQDMPENDVTPRLMQDMLAYIDREYASIRHVQDIADRFYVSVPTVNRLFRTHVHLAPHDLIISKRLACAESLLCRGASVTEVCYAAGFGDCSRFISLFKRRYGQTPLQYKKSHEALF